MAAIGPGDWVEALITDTAEHGFIAVTRGQIYCVAAAFPASYSCDTCSAVGLGLLLVGDAPTCPDVECWCGECGFRPVYRPKADLITDLLKPVEVSVEYLLANSPTQTIPEGMEHVYEETKPHGA